MDAPPAIVLTVPAHSVALAEARFARAVVDSIWQVENPRSLRARGPDGEWGDWQMKRTTWQMHTTLPFEARYVLDHEIAEGVAFRHYHWICRQLRVHGLPEGAFNVALAWNGGITHAYFPEQLATPKELDYALRVEALVKEFLK